MPPKTRRRLSLGAGTSACLLLVLSLGLNMFSGQWGLLGIPLPLDRLVLAVSVLCFLGGEDAGRRWSEVFHGQQTRLLVFGALAAWTGLSAFGAGTLLERDPLFALADKVVVPLLLFFYVPLVVRSARELDILLIGLTACGAYLGFTSVMAAVGPAALVFPHYITDSAVGLGAGRARGPSAEAVGTGVDLIVFGAAAALVALRRSRSARSWGTVVALLCFTAAFMTFTRSIWLGTALSVLVVAVKFRTLRRLLAPAIAALVTVLAGVLVLVPGVLASVTGRAGTTRSITDREYTYAAAVRMVESHPLVGVGWGRFLDNVTAYVLQSDTGPITNVRIEAHNILLARAAELGVPGLLLLVACLAVGPIQVLLRRPSGTPHQAQAHVLAVVAVVAWLAAAMLSPMGYALPNGMAWGFAGLALLRGIPHSGTSQEGPSQEGMAREGSDDVLPVSRSA